MEIRRQGSNRKTGWVTIDAKKGKSASIRVEKDKQGDPMVTLTLTKTTDIDRNGEYDHEVRLSMSDVVGVLNALSSTGLSTFNEGVSAELSGAVRSLHRLAAAASGIQVHPDVKKK